MAREIQIQSWCDLCLEEGRREEATEVSVTIGKGGTPHTLDLCKTHYQELVQPLVDALAAFGYPERAEAPEELARPRWRQGWKRNIGPFRCLAGCEAAPLKNATTLEAHLLKLHDGMTLDAYIAQYGELVPLTPEQQAEPAEVRCEIEGCDKVYSTAAGYRWPQQAMISHMRSRHDINWRPGIGQINRIEPAPGRGPR